ncbi:MAG: heat shock protein transcriptional repressor HspR [Campylobacterales bacterium]
MLHSYDEPVFLISVVAKILSIHPQTLRQYEREGLIEPGRTDGKVRLYSQRDIDRIKSILRLTRELGVNLAGVDIILRLKDRLEELEFSVDELKNQIKVMENTPKPSSRGKSLVKKSSFEVIVFRD